MAATDGDESGRVEYPRFEHGEDLLLLLRGDEWMEFRSDAPGEYVRADNAVVLAEEV